MADEAEPVTRRPVQHLSTGGAGHSALDEVAVEEPLEIRVAGETLAVTMRTPGHDHELALGLLLAEGVIAGPGDVGRIAHCGRPGEPSSRNVLEVLPGPGVALDAQAAARARRGTLTTASCGVCGRTSIDDLLERCAPLPPGPVLPLARLLEAVRTLEDHQLAFTRTGGVHAAGLIAEDGSVLAVREDVGRHNAVDKAVGALMLEGRLPRGSHAPIASLPGPSLLVVSGRVSFEIVQKAAIAGVPIVCGISAPTSLAVDLAERTNLTLAGFVRGEKLNLYAHPERVHAAM
jgi:FdhD protein